MAGTPYLVDSNVLLRWVKSDDRDYPLVVSAIDATLQRGAVFCYTSQNVAEFWNTCTRPLDRNGYVSGLPTIGESRRQIGHHQVSPSAGGGQHPEICRS
jgi:hypothetical protein